MAMADTACKLGVEHKLNQSNYKSWSWQVQNALKLAKVWRIVIGEEKEPKGSDIGNAIRMDYLNRLDLASGILCRSIDQSQHIHVATCCDSPSQIWAALKQAHTNKVPLTPNIANSTPLSTSRVGAHSLTNIYAKVALPAKAFTPIPTPCPRASSHMSCANPGHSINSVDSHSIQYPSPVNRPEVKAEFAGTTASALSGSTNESPCTVNTWTADTGATSHMTPHRHWFNTYTPQSIKIILADGSAVYAAGVGSVQFNSGH